MPPRPVDCARLVDAMKIFSLKAGDTKTLTVRLTRRGAGLSVAAESATLIIDLGSGSTLEIALSATASPGVWTHKFTKSEVAQLEDLLPAGVEHVDFPCEILLVWAEDDEETSPTEGVNLLRLFRKIS